VTRSWCVLFLEQNRIAMAMIIVAMIIPEVRIQPSAKLKSLGVLTEVRDK